MSDLTHFCRVVEIPSLAPDVPGIPSINDARQAAAGDIVIFLLTWDGTCYRFTAEHQAQIKWINVSNLNSDMNS